MPAVAISTAPGFLRLGSQHPIVVLAVVVGISGWDHQVAALSDCPPSSEETNCHVGTVSLDGFEINWTPLDNVVIVAAVLTGPFAPRPLTKIKARRGFAKKLTAL